MIRLVNPFNREIDNFCTEASYGCGCNCIGSGMTVYNSGDSKGSIIKWGTCMSCGGGCGCACNSFAWINSGNNINANQITHK